MDMGSYAARMGHDVATSWKLQRADHCLQASSRRFSVLFSTLVSSTRRRRSTSTSTWPCTQRNNAYSANVQQDAVQFEKDSKAIHDGFTSLQTDFGAFTGSFSSWAQGEENKHAKEIEDLGKEIAALEKEIGEIKGKMALWGTVGAVGTVGATAGLVLLLGPVGLVSTASCLDPYV